MRFQLVRYFTFASLIAFLLVAMVVIYSARQQSDFFRSVQSQQAGFIANVQLDFVKKQEDASVRDLLAIHENGNVNLTRLFANALWAKDFAPFVEKVQAIPVDHCRSIEDVKDAGGKLQATPEKKACFAEVGGKIRDLSEFPLLDAKVFESMKKTTAFKIKVFDMRGVTVYSSEHNQMGEDKSGNAGWKGAALDGKPTSELTHRDKFSAFEGVVENRDLISSYLPVLQPGTDKIVGVFEIYSDVTPFLEQIKKSSALIKKNASDNQRKVEDVAVVNQEQVERASLELLIIVLAMMVLLFAILYAIVSRADRIIRQQESDRERAQQQLAQSEKMASLGQMVAGVTHQLNTPLAFSYNNVSMVVDALKNFDLPLRIAKMFVRAVKNTDGDKMTINITQVRPQVAGLDEMDMDVVMLSEMLGDTLTGIDQMRELVENLRDFTRLDRAKVTAFDINKGLHNVVYLARSVAPVTVTIVEEFDAVPLVECNPSQLNQVFLNLINNAAQAISGEGTVTVKSYAEGGRVRVDVTDTGGGIAPDVLPHIFENYYTTKAPGEGTGLGLPIAKTIVEEHKGELHVATQLGKGSTFTVYLPASERQSPSQ